MISGHAYRSVKNAIWNTWLARVVSVEDQSCPAEHNYLGNFQGYKTESSRKLSNFNYQWTKTLYQNNLKNIAFLFTFFFLTLKPSPPHTWYSLPPLEVLEFFSAIIMRSLLHLLLIYLSRYSLDFSGLLRSLFSIHRLLKLSLFCSCFHRLLPYTHHSTQRCN